MTMNLALFPLSRPLFPDQVLELQIFERRYLDLVRECLKREAGFGVVAIREGHEVGATPQIFHVGTHAEISDWTQLDNGLLGITIRGGRRFRVCSTAVERSGLMRAEIDWCPDESDVPLADSHAELVSLHQQLMSHPQLRELQLQKPITARQLGWQLCQILPLPVPFCVDLLSLVDTDLRLRRLASFLWSTD